MTDLQVNSVHHQAVDCVAPGLQVTARAPDGIIEGLEPPAADRWWAVCVQWHPEEFVDERHAPDLGLFAAFAQAVHDAVGETARKTLRDQAELSVGDYEGNRMPSRT